MATSEAQKNAVKKYQSKLDRLFIRVPMGEKDRIEKHAKDGGESVNAFVKRAIDETIERDKKKKV